MTLLQLRAKQLGVYLICSPKFHPEIPGEAIEYCWALSKNKYWRYELKKKKTKAKFI